MVAVGVLPDGIVVAGKGAGGKQEGKDDKQCSHGNGS
jgi:hypothetical protein